MFGLFSKPKCPHCGGPITPTHYAFPFPQWRCARCVKANTEKRQMEERVARLEEQLKAKNL